MTAPAPTWLLDMVRPAAPAERLTIADVEKTVVDLDPTERRRLDAYANTVRERSLYRLAEMRDKATSNGTAYTGEPWNQTTFDVACTLIEIANSPWNGYPLKMAYDDLFTNAPRDSGFTDKTINATWASAVSRVGPKARPIPDRPRSKTDWVDRLPGQPESVTGPFASTALPPASSPVDPSQDLEAERAAILARDIAYELHRMRVRENARAILDLERASAIPVPPFDAGTLAEVMARPEQPTARVQGLLPAEGSMLVVAQRKAGKTTLMLNLVRSLIDGSPFLGAFNVVPIEGNVAFLNYEVSAAMLGRWASDVGIDGDRMFMVNLRGRRNPLIHDRADLTKLLRKQRTSILIVDPFGRAYGGESQNDSGEVQKWLVDLDHFAHDVGATELILSAHAGWVSERSRGASALEDWPDSIVTMVRDPDDETKRFLKAIGRDVELEEDALLFDKASRTLRLSGAGSRKAVKREETQNELLEAIVTIVADQPGLMFGQIQRVLRDEGQVSFRKGDDSRAAQGALARGLVRIEPRGRAKHYFPTDRALAAAVCASCGHRTFELVDGVSECRSCQAGR